MQPIPSRQAQPPSYRGLGSGTAHVPLHLVSHVHPQVGVGSVKPAGLFLLLLLGMLAQGGDWDTILFEHKGSDCGWDFHFAFVFGFLLDKGVAVCIACSVALREQNQNCCGGQRSTPGLVQPQISIRQLSSQVGLGYRVDMGLATQACHPNCSGS